MKIGAIFLLIVVAVGTFLFFSGHSERASELEPSPSVSLFPSVNPSPESGPTNSATPQPPSRNGVPSPEPTATGMPAGFTVRITSAGVIPSELTVSVGDTVTFVNETESRRWPASDPHPVHTLCPGFDSGGIVPGSSYDVTFTVVRNCTYHDHLSPGNSGLKGVITVQ